MAGENDWYWDEDEYIESLTGERRRYAWVLERFGGVAPAEAEAQAVDFYRYEEPGEACRGLIFHDEAWHWAMLRLYGSYWLTHSELAEPSDEYRAID
ncbi:hypothetical protein [Nocardia sp. SSK8]|uniref:hypothetical protein n=1 Tax=Nocardia sp. SSK8 TaxID=3120154 RepID=UPI00300913E6